MYTMSPLFSITCDSFLILVIPFLFHFYHFPLNTSVVDVTEVLHVLLHSLGDRVSHHWCEAALAFLKVFMIFHGGDVSLGFSHPSHLRSVQHVGCFALYLFPEAIRIKNLSRRDREWVKGLALSWFCSLKDLPAEGGERSWCGWDHWFHWEAPARQVTGSGTG